MNGGRQLDDILKPLIQLSANEAGCWRWLGKIDKKTGYGHKQSSSKTLLAHRWIYKIFKGHIPIATNIDHLCRNRWCVNPDHLEAVHQTINCRRGVGTKLDEASVRRIKHLLRSGIKWGERGKLAKQFGVSPGLISDIKYGRAWADI